ncbi:hypothetical protein IMCC1989_335 [gamma proteobacterium IMCC1989]|nr:hypothetical protein IMCC1989_335 [gamma proteobacterium IMCC1989]
MTKTILHGAGIGLKAQHYDEILRTKPAIDWLEVHPENYMGAGGLPHKYLREIAEIYPLSMHGVGLSLGSVNGVSDEHLAALTHVVNCYQPAQVSEHLSWSHWNQHFLNDLLPLPYNQESLAVVANNIHKVQDALKQKIYIENPSSYLGFHQSDLSETDFLRELVKQTDCGLLLDINNVYVSVNNQHGTQYQSAEDYINDYPLAAVGEIHLAGHAQETIENEIVLIDDHGSPVINEVWDLYSYTMEKIATQTDTLPPVLIEWDTDIPELGQLVSEAEKARRLQMPVTKNVSPDNLGGAQ